jgi:hypothetical protein
LASRSMVRAMNVAPEPAANWIGFTGWSSDPSGVDLVTFPASLAGEYWPFVSP